MITAVVYLRSTMCVHTVLTLFLYISLESKCSNSKIFKQYLKDTVSFIFYLDIKNYWLFVTQMLWLIRTMYSSLLDPAICAYASLGK